MNYNNLVGEYPKKFFIKFQVLIQCFHFFQKLKFLGLCLVKYLSVSKSIAITNDIFLNKDFLLKHNFQLNNIQKLIKNLCFRKNVNTIINTKVFKN